ncbi:MAG: hypothetical protein ACM3ML_36820 [Micromonosporaceae bacterium]
MDHGNPELDGAIVWFCSDGHTTFSPPGRIGDRLFLVPGDVDPTTACHERLYLFSGEEVIGCWPVGLRGWQAGAVPVMKWLGRRCGSRRLAWWR